MCVSLSFVALFSVLKRPGDVSALLIRKSTFDGDRHL